MTNHNNQNNNYNDKQGNAKTMNMKPSKNNYEEYRNELNVKGDEYNNKYNNENNYNNILQTTHDSSPLLPLKPPRQSYFLIPNKDMLKSGGNELLLTSNRMSDLNNNPVLPNADSNANTNQFTELGRKLGAIETNPNINIPLGKIHNFSWLLRNLALKHARVSFSKTFSNSLIIHEQFSQ
jgi:hypothetical protein